MGNPNEPINPATEDERRLRGSNLDGAEQDEAVDHETHLKRRNPDTELHLDGEKDDLYSDGIDVDESTDNLAGTRGSSAGAKGNLTGG
jgi:hypothetical protein